MSCSNLVPRSRRALALVALTALFASPFALMGCSEGDARDATLTASSCMKCHNGSLQPDYAGPGIENPHPFEGADDLRCITCHGGNPLGIGKDDSHVPPPPEIGDREYQERNREAFFNRLTLTGIDKYPDYTANGRTYTALEWLQFVNPGDLRVTQASRGCGQCHAQHSDTVAHSLLATSAGLFSGATYTLGVNNRFPEAQNLHQDTAADTAFRSVRDEDWVADPLEIGSVGRLSQFPVYSRREESPGQLFRNDDYLAAAIDSGLDANGRAITDSPLAHLFHEQVAFTCGDCHLGSAGANNRSADYRSSGCTACHMPYSLDGRSRSRDPNVPKDEPEDPDDIDPGERAHVRAHRIRSVRQTLASGEEIYGIDDLTCAGCHQGSNRTVMQFWGIRLDQNQDVRRGNQYPANPVSFRNTANDERLFPDDQDNREFNGRNPNQYLLFEDYDGDERDDTPADVHHEAGMGCIDCHSGYDLHGGDVNDPASNRLWSRMEQAVAIRCESCHGSIDAYATTTRATTHAGVAGDVAVDAEGNPLTHVVREGDGNYYLYSKLTGNRHYVSQTRDTVVDSGKTHPFRNGKEIYSPKASYAMGRADGDPSTGIGPQQDGFAIPGFSHTDRMDCASCHSSWTNTCTGCHLVGEYDEGNNFSNITGERIAFDEKFAEFVYQSPVPFQLGVGPRGKITGIAPNTTTFFSWEDRNNDRSRVFTFSDRNGNGSNPSSRFPALSHNAMMAHSIRGKVTAENEGPRYCVSCHLTDRGLNQYRTEYSQFRQALRDERFDRLDFDVLKQHIGQNPGNQMDSPLWVHMVAGLGSGLFLFDEDGCPVNPLDENEDRFGCEGVAPATVFDPSRVVYNLDRIVDPTGLTNASNTHPLLDPTMGPLLRDGAANQEMAGPLGASMIQYLTNPNVGLILDSWIDADGVIRGQAGNFIR